MNKRLLTESESEFLHGWTEATELIHHDGTGLSSLRSEFNRGWTLKYQKEIRESLSNQLPPSEFDYGRLAATWAAFGG
jgi:hypothetical protein